jgi:hypothetical protein
MLKFKKFKEIIFTIALYIYIYIYSFDLQREGPKIIGIFQRPCQKQMIYLSAIEERSIFA